MSDKPILFQGAMVRALLDGRKNQTRRVLKAQPETRCKDAHLGTDGIWRFSWPTATNPISYSRNDTNTPIQIGDRLWVREAWRPKDGFSNWDLQINYPADNSTLHFGDEIDLEDWRFPKAAEKGNVPSIYMPRWASRLTLEVTDVRIQRVQDISAHDAFHEGIERVYSPNGFRNYHTGDPAECLAMIPSFRSLWNSINAKPKPKYGRDEDGKEIITHYQSFPWAGESRTETYRGKPHIITANPWVAAYSFTIHKHNIDQDQS